jgi:hypothetical protein
MTDDFIMHWANYVKENPTEWKVQHTKFINAIFEKHYAWQKRMLQKPNGKEILAKLAELRIKK